MEKIFVPDPPPLIKDRIPRGARKRPGAVDRSACMIAVQISALFILDSGPPPSVKGRTEGGVRNPLWTVDLSAGLRAVQICSKLIINSGPPPPLKIERRGGSGIHCGPLISAPFHEPSRSARRYRRHSDPPPSVKSRTDGGVRDQL
jgi:hypothetical protein